MQTAPLLPSPRLLAGLLVTLNAPGVAAADPAAPGEPPGHVALVLRGDQVGLRVELSPVRGPSAPDRPEQPPRARGDSV
ncbi:MAG TPA: hypothetical protein PLU22_18670 [Polyangiaceae bacterium]|nr:hypothetical protein [Polyangiaceae bacterium]